MDNDRALAIPAAGRPFKPNCYEGKPRFIAPSHKKLLESFIQPMRDRIAAMNDRELNTLIVAFQSVSPINCSWQQFALAEMLFSNAESAVHAPKTNQGTDNANK